MFQSDVFDISVGKEVEIKSPIDGRIIKKAVPEFGAIISNLPFVEYNKIAEDERKFIVQIGERIQKDTEYNYTSRFYLV